MLRKITRKTREKCLDRHLFNVDDVIYGTILDCKCIWSNIDLVSRFFNLDEFALTRCHVWSSLLVWRTESVSPPGHCIE